MALITNLLRSSGRCSIQQNINSLSTSISILQKELTPIIDTVFHTRCPTHSFYFSTRRTVYSESARPSTARVLDGRAVSAKWLQELAYNSADVTSRGGRPPGLGVILVGDRPDSLLYVQRKQEACERVGIRSIVRHLPASISQVALRRAVQSLCSDPQVDGVLVQLPLPLQIDEEDIIEHFDPGKDVDGFHPLNVGRTLMRGRSARFVPCTALGCIELLKRSDIKIQGSSVAIVGDSNIVGMPLAMLFRDEGAATVTVVHRSSYSNLLFSDKSTSEQRAEANACLPHAPGPTYPHTAVTSNVNWSDEHFPSPRNKNSEFHHHREAQPYQVTYSSGMRDAYLPSTSNIIEDPASIPGHLAELAGITRTADILIVAVGFPHLVKKDWIKPGAVIVDVGINVVDWGEGYCPVIQCESKGEGEEEQNEEHPHFHVVGDVDFTEVRSVASAVSPVPGGVGPMTIAALLHNTIHAAAIRMGLRREGDGRATSKDSLDDDDDDDDDLDDEERKRLERS